MDFDLTDEQKMLIETLRTMGERENFKDLAKEVDATGDFPTHLIAKFAEMGLLGMVLSPEYEGGGQPADEVRYRNYVEYGRCFMRLVESCAASVYEAA